MPSVAVSKSIEASDFREWPIFDWVRDDQKINKTFEQVYGEPIRNKIPEAETGVKPKAKEDFDVGFSDLSGTPKDVTTH